MLKRDKGTNLFATNKPPAQLFSPRGRRKVAHSELFSYLCATQAPGRGAARAHSSVGQSSGLIIRRSWDHAPLGPPDKPEYPEGCPGFCFARQGRGHAVRLLRAVHPPGTPPACTTRPPETPPPARHVRRKLLLARTTHESLPSARHVPSAPDSADAAEGRFTASFCRFTDRTDSPLPEQPCSIWDFSYLCTLPSHEPHFSSP